MKYTGGSILPEEPKKKNENVRLFGIDITIVHDENDPFYGATLLGGYVPKAKPYNTEYKPNQADDDEN